MTKIFLTLIAPLAAAFASQQLVLVLSDELNATSAILQRYEKKGEWRKIGAAVPVTMGRSGMGYALGKEPLKYEGDGRSPAGIFPITASFGYDEHPMGKMPYMHADERLICVDDINDSRYGRIVSLEGEMPKSFEWMRREDGVYRHGALIGYNSSGEKGRGSCIFIHLNHPDKRPTSGCTAMDETPLRELLEWLDPDKNPQILQIPKSECAEYKKEFEGIECD
ncbi:MAG: L,D-transpeptidase family protein [Campylobacterales bacterium]|nr:L,D-transpeptidase family protein [Campylobacterales bacterium]